MERPVSNLETLLDERTDMFLRIIADRCPEYREEDKLGEAVIGVMKSIDNVVREANPLVVHLAIMGLCRAMEAELGMMVLEQQGPPPRHGGGRKPRPIRIVPVMHFGVHDKPALCGVEGSKTTDGRQVTCADCRRKVYSDGGLN